MKGTLVNAAAVLVGSGVGLCIKRGIPPKYQETVMQGLGLAIVLIGMQMAMKTQNILIVIISLVIGGLVGEKINIEGFLTAAGDKLGEKLGSSYGDVGKGFVTASLMYCVGAMTIVGAIQDGLAGDASTLYAKSTLDGISSVVFTSTMGIGVAFSAITILVYQGALTLLAGLCSSLLNPAVISEMTSTGGILIIGIGIMMLEIKKINVANLLPAIPVAAAIALAWPA